MNYKIFLITLCTLGAGISPLLAGKLSFKEQPMPSWFRMLNLDETLKTTKVSPTVEHYTYTPKQRQEIAHKQSIILGGIGVLGFCCGPAYPLIKRIITGRRATAKELPMTLLGLIATFGGAIGYGICSQEQQDLEAMLSVLRCRDAAQKPTQLSQASQGRILDVDMTVRQQILPILPTVSGTSPLELSSLQTINAFLQDYSDVNDDIEAHTLLEKLSVSDIQKQTPRLYLLLQLYAHLVHLSEKQLRANSYGLEQAKIVAYFMSKIETMKNFRDLWNRIQDKDILLELPSRSAYR